MRNDSFGKKHPAVCSKVSDLRHAYSHILYRVAHKVSYWTIIKSY